jgi:D-alanyl-D-alanine carboxypeptidase/D-alanyl-D-alanine-endopeptidase (penicillin-binding protein 4)
MKNIGLLLPTLLLTLQLLAINPVDSFVNNELLENASISLLVKDMTNNQTIYDYRSKTSIVPASTLKLVTTATALELLGPDFCFETKLEIDGTIGTDSILTGNLFIHGGGDPTLGSNCFENNEFLDKWVEMVKKAGIKMIKGRVIADASLFDDEGVNPKWTWEDIGNYYAAGAYGIAYLDNTLRITLRSDILGYKPEIVKITPEIPGLSIDNQLLSTNITYDSAYFYGAPHSNNRSIYGEIPAFRTAFIVKGDIPNPGLLLAQHFNEKLEKAGITISIPPTDNVSVTTKREVIYTHLSPSLSEIVTEINIHSNNLYAEHLFKYLALKNNKKATSNGAIQVVKSFWKSKGLPVDQLFMYDGSGLSPVNAVSANFFVDLLLYMNTKSNNKDAFFNSLPVAGESGTLSSLLKNTPLQGKVHAKSGTISRVKCYAGYVDANDKKYVFALMVNNANGNSKAVTKKIEKFLLSTFVK